ncbi:MAG TPA: hypothetical protein VMV46_02470 [Thermoanaerobaculia bacterium]|nr:hypothetical protein [Thermoanaerobaculia bacterium]
MGAAGRRDGEPPDSGRDDRELEESESHGYFLAIEEHFLRRRGAPMMLSPADWRIARGWAELGVPLRVVHGVLDRVFEQRRERGAKGRVQGLRFFDNAVRAAWSEILELRGPAPAPAAAAIAELEVAARLEELAAALPAELPERDHWRAAIRGCAPGPEAPAPDLQAVEEALRAADRELLAAARGWLDREALEAERAAVAPALEALRGRLPADAVERTEERLLDRRLRDRFGLPELSLFSHPPRT